MSNENEREKNGVEKSGGESEKISVIKTLYDTIWSYSYESEIEKLADLYEKAKKEQWNASEALDWSIDVDLEKLAKTSQLPPLLFQGIWEKLDDRKRVQLAISNITFVMSQILHGEQGALLVASQLVSCAPQFDEKLVASTQVVDEARHVEAFHRYLFHKVKKEFPISPHLETLLRTILSEQRWYFKFVGMQILVEGLAMGIFGMLDQYGEEPLGTQIVRYVLKDEARHVAFGVISLKQHIDELPESEKKELAEFAYEGCVHLKNRITDMRMVWDDVGLPAEESQRIVEQSPLFVEFISLLFSRVVPNLKKLGLLRDELRPHYEKLGILKFENFEPTL